MVYLVLCSGIFQRCRPLLVAHALQLSIWATSEPHGSVPRRRLGRTYRLSGRWNLSACVANAVAAEDHHIVLTRLEKRGLAAGHVLMDVLFDGVAIRN